LLVSKTADDKAGGCLADAKTADDKAGGALTDPENADDTADAGPGTQPMPAQVQ
jgi:hypothetical protein